MEATMHLGIAVILKFIQPIVLLLPLKRMGAFALPPQAVIVPLALRAAKVLPAE
jgi:hypothetical protein